MGDGAVAPIGSGVSAALAKVAHVPQTLSRAQARRIALAAQGFARPRPHEVGTRALTSTLRRMGVLQIDSVNVFARSHYLPSFSRLGAYDTALLDRQLFHRSGPFVESWAHVAAFIPVQDWPLFAFRRAQLRQKYGGEGSWFATHAATVDWVRAELRARGPLRPAQIEQDARSTPRGPWWDWNEVKQALELLTLFGEVAVTHRRGFERVYALTEEVLPDQAAAPPVAYDDAVRELIRRAARAYGVATLADLQDYWRVKDRGAATAAVHDLVDSGEVAPVHVEGWTRGGRPIPAWLWTDAPIPRRVDAATILTPFDPVVWFRDRAERLFDFDYRIEIYTPAAQRRFGYYSLPVLIGDDVVGRVDLKADRAGRRLLVQSAWWEHGRPDDAPERLAGVLAEAAAWQGLEDISVSDWGDAAGDVASALPHATRHSADRGSTDGGGS